MGFTINYSYYDLFTIKIFFVYYFCGSIKLLSCKIIDFCCPINVSFFTQNAVLYPSFIAHTKISISHRTFDTIWHVIFHLNFSIYGRRYIDHKYFHTKNIYLYIFYFSRKHFFLLIFTFA